MQRLLKAILMWIWISPANAADLAPLTPVSTEYTRVQIADWIDKSTFAVGRWDGSLAIFWVGAKPVETMTLDQSFITSSGDGVEMVGALDEQTVIVSDGASQLGLLVRSKTGQFAAPTPVPYDSAYGVANSFTSPRVSGTDLVITGHANGFALVWKRTGGTLSLLQAIDLKSAQPIPSPYPLKNIRGLAAWEKGIIVSGSEDGDIVAFSAESGKVLFRQRYSPNAERGINALSLSGDTLLVVNCAVGEKDRNLWLYRMTDAGFVAGLNQPCSRVTRKQVFDFDVDVFESGGKTRFVSSTEEGLIWSGSVVNGRLLVDGMGDVSNNGAASLDVNPDDASILAGAQDLMLFPPLN
jgi:WD40 repeat protein